jgi:hypothetical protein
MAPRRRHTLHERMALMRATIEHGSASVHSPRPGPDTLSTQVRLTLEIVVTAHDASPPCAARWNYGAREGTSMDKGMRKDTTMWSSVWLRAGRGGRSFATWTGSNRVKSKFTTWRGGMRMTQREHDTGRHRRIQFVETLFTSCSSSKALFSKRARGQHDIRTRHVAQHLPHDVEHGLARFQSAVAGPHQLASARPAQDRHRPRAAVGSNPGHLRYRCAGASPSTPRP